MSNATPWIMLRNELANFLTGQAGGNDATEFRGLQTDTGLLPALWDNQDHGKWLGFQMADEIPLWGPAYRPSSNKVTDAYPAFLTNIDAPAQDQAAADRTKQLREKLADALTEISRTRLRMGSEWKLFNDSQKDLPPSAQLSFEAWFAADWGQRLGALQVEYENVAAAWVAEANKAGGGYQALGQALLDYNNPAFQVDAKDPDGAILKYRTWSLLPALSDFIAEAKAGQGVQLSLTISTSTSTTDITQSSFNLEAGFSLGFIGISGGGGHERLTVDTHSLGFEMSFSSPAVTGISVRPGNWYKGQVVKQFKDGPFISNGPFGPGKAVFFGPDGTFSLEKMIVYVAYQPSVTATVDEHSYSRVKDSWKANAGISIGPFSFGGGAGGSTDHATFTDGSRTITMQSSSPHPQILATQCLIMPG